MSTVKAEDVNDERDDYVAADLVSGDAAARARLARKRTKTGCLTCRRRRIKCDEGKPVCRNCQKSRRQCEGYNQRVIFKPADFQYLGPHGAATITFHTSMLPGAIGPSHGEHSSFGQPELRPRAVPPPGYALNHGPDQYQFVPSYQGVTHIPARPFTMQPPTESYMQPPQAQNFGTTSYAMPFQNPYLQTLTGEFAHQASIDALNRQQTPYASFNQLSYPPAEVLHPVDGAVMPQHAWNQSALPPQVIPTPTWPEQQLHSGQIGPDSGSNAQWQQPSRVTISQTHTTTTVHQEWPATAVVPRPELVLPIGQHQLLQSIHPTPKFIANQLYEHPVGTESPVPLPLMAAQVEDTVSHQSASPARVLEEAAIQHYDDDYYDVDQEDETDLELSAKILEQKSQGIFREIVAMSGLDTSVLKMRGFGTFIYDGILDTYRPEMAANPLKNSATARVFAHFITATGPLLTIFVRQTRVSSALHHDGPLPLNQQGLWTYIMPMAALHHQGLLQAILAISSLHIAKLQRASETPSFKHYGYALKSIHRTVREPEKRHSAATLAATLLLGYYEIMAANHTNWNTHLAGAKQLVTEIDFLSMTKQFREMKRDKAFRDQHNPYYMPGMPPLPYNTQPHDVLLEQIPDIDEDVVGIFAGKSLRYDQHGHVTGEHDTGPTRRNNLPLDVVNYETLKDLFWWYCKQDVYQSIISGNPLMMSFDHWTDCPPRAPLNAADAVCGSFDHLMILLARIADFTTRDRKRKLKVMQANGGVWLPDPSMQMGPRPSAGPPRPGPPSNTPGGPGSSTDRSPANPGSTPQMPFFGMAPPAATSNTMPSSYQPSHQTTGSAKQTPTPDASPCWSLQDLSLMTEQALQEWEQIKAAADFFVATMGPSFQALGPEYQPPMQCPFGPVIFYRSWDISCLWGIYNMCLIILIRSHPHMPPAAHMAAGVAAFQTRDLAMDIGRIAAGVVLPPSDEPLNPNLAASVCDLAVPLFFAGISYQAPDQRAWVVERLFDVDRRAGWATAGIIAEGCQSAWIKAAAAGRGPSHERIQKANFSDNRVHRYQSSFQVVQGKVEVPEQDDDLDRKFVHQKAATRLHWGIGIIGGEDDYSPGSQ